MNNKNNSKFIYNSNLSLGISIAPIIMLIFLFFLNIITGIKYERTLLVVQLFVVTLQIASVINKLPTKYMYYFVACFYCITATLVNGSGLGTIIQFIIITSLLILSSEQALLDKQKNLINVIFAIMLLTIMIIFSNKLDGSYYSIVDASNKLNPNSYATIALFFAIIMHVIIKDIPIKTIGIVKTIQIIIAVIMGIVIYTTKSRTSLGAYLIYIVLLFIDFLFNKLKKPITKRYYPRILLVAILISFLIVTLYLVLFNIYDGKPIIILGKNLFSGREQIWKEAVSCYFGSFQSVIVGVSNKYEYWQGFTNIHNGFLTLLCNLTIVGLVTFCVLMINNVKCKYDQQIDKYKFFAIISIVVLATFENMLLDNAFGLMMAPFIFNKTRRSNDRQSN